MTAVMLKAMRQMYLPNPSVPETIDSGHRNDDSQYHERNAEPWSKPRQCQPGLPPYGEFRAGKGNEGEGTVRLSCPDATGIESSTAGTLETPLQRP